ncbi:DNA-binding transcriptional ArsR family regulator [Alkalibacillus flavidus]|uniref:DNA-binding transcriptional ArsR family regulator n=1 Tax=Alkalibacillus flavidus TaxID=546021 RepID=A0ABV2KZE8_9BACI
MKLANCASDITEDQLKHVYHKVHQTNTSSVSNLFKVLADPTRVKIAQALTIEDELCVCDVAAIMEVSVATASHHLRTLKQYGLTNVRKQGKISYYSLDDHHIVRLIQMAVEHEEKLEALS